MYVRDVIDNSMDKKEIKYWNSLGQLKDSPEYRKQILEEYETEKSWDPNKFSRRNFLSIMGASIALAGLAGCRRPVEKIFPYTKQSEEIVPGVPLFFATTMPLGTSSYGIIVESHEGRPTKIEGNPKHPSSMGATNIFTQAAILNLYDPDRTKKVLYNGTKKEIDDFASVWKVQLEKYIDNDGEGLAILSESFASPTLANQKSAFEKQFPKAKWVAYEPISDENSHKAIKNLTGKTLQPVYHYDKADIILSLDADILQMESESVSCAQGFGKNRSVKNTNDKMNRLYVVETGYSVTGASADHRLKMRSSDIGHFVLALAKELSRRNLEVGDLDSYSGKEFDQSWIEAIAEDLFGNGGKSILVAGQTQPQWVHEAVLLINESLGNFGSTITFSENKESVYSSLSDLMDLKESIENDKVETLIIVGGNPVYNSPIDFNFAKLCDKVKQTIQLSEYFDETSAVCNWHIPRAHFLESWGDARAIDGTVSIIQPLIAPLYNGISDIEFISLLISGEPKSGYDIVREIWDGILKGDFEKGWRKALHDGLLENSSQKPLTARLNKSKLTIIDYEVLPANDEIEIVFKPSPVYDGRFSNNGWLQELPDPITKLVWDNAACMSANTALRFNLKNGDIINLKVSQIEMEVPVWIIPGYANDSIQLTLGYGRKHGGRIDENVGVNTYQIRDSSQMYIASNASISKTGKTHTFANTQDHNRMEGRPIYRESTLNDYKQNPKFAKEMVKHPPLKSLYPDYDYSKGYQWGMVVDLNSCIGCGVCTLACQSENNIPIVGKEQVGNGREMHWMRNDRYFKGTEENPDIAIMPVTCQHCENAPCEQVCPVAATTHDEEGINTMTYNRCIGTRYCSNNCPYKVRKFNFFNYTKDLPEVVQMAQNPDVTVRSRGVMEKCTFCIQRINRFKMKAKQEDRTVKDGEFQVACQQACPSNAITFGNINDKKSEVAQLKMLDRNYEILAELNVRPRNSYLARVKNRNPKLVT